MSAVELVADRADRAPLRLTARRWLALERALAERGVLCFVDNPVIVAPPLVVTDDEVDVLVGAVAESVWGLAGTGRGPKGGRG